MRWRLLCLVRSEIGSLLGFYSSHIRSGLKNKIKR